MQSLMSEFIDEEFNAPVALTREAVETMLNQLSDTTGTSLHLDQHNSVALSYYENQEAILMFLETCGLLLLAASVAHPAQMELPRLRDLLEFNMEWVRPSAIIIPDNDTRAHLTYFLPVDPRDPTTLEKCLTKALTLAGEVSCAASVAELPVTKTTARAILA